MRSRQEIHSQATLLGLGLLCSLWLPQAHAQRVPDTTEAWGHVIAQLPAPKDKPASWPRSCLNTTKEFLEARKLTYASPEVAAKFGANRELSRVLGIWGVQRLHMPSDSKLLFCTDVPYVLSKLQEAAGDEPTGVLGERDIARLDAAIRLGVEKSAQAIVEREKNLLTIFGIPMGAPLRMTDCPIFMEQRAKFVPATCKQQAGRPGQFAPTAMVYFSEADSPTWLSSLGGGANPSLRLDISDGMVTAIHFEPKYQGDSIAVEALSAKFGVSPKRTVHQNGTCVNSLTGRVGDCPATGHDITWNVKDFIVRGDCNYQIFRCRYVIQLASAVAANEEQTQKERAEQKERALRSGRPL